jgi:hypothetical protein
MKTITLLLSFMLNAIYTGIGATVCVIVPAAITWVISGNNFSTTLLQVHFTWFNVVVMFVLTMATFFLWMIVDTAIRKKRTALGKTWFV